MLINGQDLMNDLDSLAQISEDPNALTRTFLSAAHQQAASTLMQWMHDAGMQTRVDAAANVIGRYEGQSDGLPALMIGSHYDTVCDAGRFDGAYGILAAIHCVRALARHQQRLPFAIEVVGFSEEEGVRYNATLLGSRAIAGTFDTSLLSHKDARGITMSDAFKASGFDPDLIPSAQRRAGDFLGFIELHIEQGPVLIANSQPVGVVTSIAAARRFDVSVRGISGHAGTVPMNMRHDAAAAAAEATLALESLCQRTPGMVGTVGKLHIPGGAANVIPGKAFFSVDIRSEDQLALDDCTGELDKQLTAIGERRKVTFELRQTHAAAATLCSEWLTTQLAASVRRAGFDPVYLPSGAGHDAMAMADLIPMAMLFVRCGNGGISHHPDETMTLDDAQKGAEVLLDFLQHFQRPDSHHS